MHSRVSLVQHKYGIQSWLAMFALCLVPGLTLAQSHVGWISDQFEVTLRNGRSTQQSIIKLLPTGTRVTVLWTPTGMLQPIVQPAGTAAAAGVANAVAGQ